MEFSLASAEVFVPDGLDEAEALARTTHLGVAAHQDDLELMTIDGILRCFHTEGVWFSGVVVTNGSGSPRTGLYAETTDDEMRLIRRAEQKKAAVVGEYASQVFLDYTSAAVKDGSNASPVADLKAVLEHARPEVVYTHNLADKHDTHVAVALRLVKAIRALPTDRRPHLLYGCECWRDLDWLVDDEKVVFDCSDRENLQAALLGVFDSQISGGKRYDLAGLARRRANATYYQSHATDIATGLTYAMDLTPLIEEPELDVATFVQGAIDRFAENVAGRLVRLL
jgi:LmbE family N-acetylglucosaminyl deacetylase